MISAVKTSISLSGPPSADAVQVRRAVADEPASGEVGDSGEGAGLLELVGGAAHDGGP
jgi:hypothetical protein